ncbi:molybdate ABC transporter substrate-binding protein [Aliikangiella maris]|uniref:Molybdate ABC transporter substrate-binding protein n=2 Tax=Aliikangiella maris TaxID=3162458 RepID=A0ABV2BZ50_9GAMM
MKVTLIFFSFLLGVGSHSLRAETVNIAVASNFAKPMQAIVSQFMHQTPHQAKLSYASSGKIYAQIIHGAPFDIFLSADQAKPLALEQQQRIVNNTRQTYAIGRLALWSNYPQQQKIRAQSLSKSTLNKIAVANPDIAPYGAAAIEVLNHLKLYSTVKSRLIYGENIAQTFQFVSSRNADLGFISLSQVWYKGHLTHGSVWPIPTELHAPIKQDLVLLKRAKHNQAAQAMLTFLQSEQAQQIITDYGYLRVQQESNHHDAIN